MKQKPRNSLIESYKLFCNNIFEWKGRTRRSDFWQVILLNNIFICLFRALVVLLSKFQSISIALYAILLLMIIYFALFTIPIAIGTIGLCVRRLHDIGKDGINFLWFFLPGIGEIFFIIFGCKDSLPEENEYGISPKYYIDSKQTDIQIQNNA